MRRSLLAVAAAFGLLAGCVATPTAAPVAPPAGWDPFLQPRIEAPGYYAIAHEGGPLAVAAVGGMAAVDVFGGDDARLAGFQLGATGAGLARATVEAPAGELVLHVRSLAGRLDVASGDGRVQAFRALADRVDRVPLAAGSGVPVAAWLAGPDREEDLQVTLPRAPTDIRLLLRGSVRDVELVLHGAGGTVFEMRGAAFSLLPAVVFPDGFHPIGGEFLRENVVDGRLAGTLAVSGLEGELVLEAASFSRAAATVSASVDWTQPAPSFRNGLVEAPSVVTVPDGASRLSLLLEPDRAAGRDDEAWVAVFGPHDERLAVLRLRPGEVATLATPWAGDYVVAPLSGRVVVGADRLSSDFEPRPLALERTHAPAQPSRSGMDVRNETVEPRGVPFAVAFEPARATLFGCPDAFLRLDHAGDAIAVQDGRRAPDLLRASALLGDGGLTVASHAAPRGCTPAAFVITAYLRG